ncbi:hypothetical protein KI387_013680 [Taxus chinensis]|uniref:Uncharacterized protein n=1 Tax=Taxus chinensis TaxID=29808 RepID=A0AA38FHF6_TAXCH|nr:hypothetical protein KI387_013680 [Taxus chinensis]
MDEGNGDLWGCKAYDCLINWKNQKGFDDCKDCFDLQFRENTQWLASDGGTSLNFSINEVLALKKNTIRIGDGADTFVVQMRERNIAIVTTSMNFNGTFNNFIASRGVVFYTSVS